MLIVFLRNQKSLTPPPVARNHWFGTLCLVIALCLLTACAKPTGGASGPGSPLKVRASIEPEPVVGQTVNWQIEIYSTGPEFQDTMLRVELPKGVELVSGDPDWKGTVPAGGTVPLELVIRVTTPGEWKVTAAAVKIHDAQNVTTGSKTLYIISSETSAAFVEDIDWVGTPIPSLQIAPAEESPLSNV